MTEKDVKPLASRAAGEPSGLSEALNGVKQIMQVRLYKERTTKDASNILLMTEFEFSKSADTSEEATKDGTVVIPSGVASEGSMTILKSVANTDAINMLEKAMDDNELVEYWIIDYVNEDGEKQPARYAQGYVTDITESSPSDGAVEVELEFKFNGKTVKGLATYVRDSKGFDYEFADTKKVGA